MPTPAMHAGEPNHLLSTFSSRASIDVVDAYAICENIKAIDGKAASGNVTCKAGPVVETDQLALPLCMAPRRAGALLNAIFAAAPPYRAGQPPRCIRDSDDLSPDAFA